MHTSLLGYGPVLRTVADLFDYVDEVGFLPLFAGSVPGLSVEEHTALSDWWSDDPETDPWLWRQIAAESGRVAYGKFFEKKAGFVSLDRLPQFVNYRRDGYDFDSRYEDGKADHRQKKLMDIFDDHRTHYSFELKKSAGFGKGGEKNFEGTVTDLQMKTYLCVHSFVRRTNKEGAPYGWPVSVYAVPEDLWGADFVRRGYAESPAASRDAIADAIRKAAPKATEKQIKAMLG